MMGKDCERILSSIASTKDDLMDELFKLHEYVSSNTPVESDKVTIHHNDGSTEDIIIHEKASTTSRLAESSRSTKIDDDLGKIGKLGSSLYTDVNKFNNSYGSPWTELNRFHDIVSRVNSIRGNVTCVSQALSLMSLINAAISYSVDAKNALITYHDYVQRGYDYEYNDKEPSIQFANGYGSKSNGNIRQNYSNNVNIKQPSIDPF